MPVERTGIAAYDVMRRGAQPAAHRGGTTYVGLSLVLVSAAVVLSLSTSLPFFTSRRTIFLFSFPPSSVVFSLHALMEQRRRVKALIWWES